MPDELYAWLGEARDELHLQFVLEKNNCIFEAVSLADLEAGEYGHHLTPWRFYIGDDATTLPIVDPDLNPNRWGLVTCDRPEIVDGDTLLMAEITSKSDYPDEDRMTRENPAGHQLLAKLRRRFSKKLSGPVWIGRVGENASVRPLRDVRFSEGAAEWFRNGGKLRYRGAPKTEYTIELTD